MKAFILILALGLSGCTSIEPAKIYPTMPPNSEFTRRITLPWGTTEVVYRTGPDVARSVR